jgi:NTE family protein
MRKLYFLLIFLSGFFIEALAQDSLVVYTKRGFKGDRPKIGLVLSGGGAKGIAHVGFLRVMEEAGIHPDYITGTSMGSIVGGLYAIGFTVDSIQQMMEKQDWTEILSNKIDFRRVNMEEKPDYGEYFTELPMHGWKPGLPSGAIKGQQLELLFEKLTVSVANDTSYDEFYIPYRAVATDLLTGKPYVFSSGPLAIAMRSSMSIPTIMQPIEYKGMLLVDGGLVRNFPVEEVLKMGADIVIGVYTGGQLLPEEDLNNMVAILKQSSLMGGILDAQSQRKKVDIYIEPDLNDMSAADFSSAVEFYKRGYVAAKKKLPELKALAEYMKQFDVPEKKRPVLTDSVYISDVQYTKLSNKKYNSLARKVLSLTPGRSVTPEDIEESINRLYGTRLFKKVGYHFEKAPNGTGAVLKYDLIERESKHLNFGIQYRNESKIGLIVGLKLRNVLLPMSKLNMKFRLSEYPALRLRYFTYMGYSTKLGTSISYNLYASDVPIYEDRQLTARYTRYLSNVNGDISYFPSINMKFSLFGRYEVSNYKRSIDAENTIINNIKAKSWFSGIVWESNTLDAKYFSERGIRIKVMGVVNADSKEEYVMDPDSVAVTPGLDPSYTYDFVSFLQTTLDLEAYSHLAKRWVLSNELFAIISTEPFGELIHTYMVGGMFPSDPNQMAFWGLPENSIFMNNGWIYRLGIRYMIVKNLFVTTKINGLFYAEDLSDIFNSDPTGDLSYIGNPDNYLLGIGLEAAYKSPIGPIGAGFAINSVFSGVWTHIRIGFVF